MFAECNASLDVVFILDLSGSVKTEYDLIVDFTRRTVAGLDVDSDLVRVGVVTYDYNVTNVIYLNAYIGRQRNFSDALNFIHDEGRTNTQVGLLEGIIQSVVFDNPQIFIFVCRSPMEFGTGVQIYVDVIILCDCFPSEERHLKLNYRLTA